MRGRDLLRRGLAAGVGVALAVLSGCGAKTPAEPKPSAVTMSYSTGIAENGEYDTSMFGMNGLGDIGLNDPGCIYVSEEEDPEWGGYFYCYPGGFAGGDEGAQFDDEYFTENHIANYAGICFRSKDLYNWERVGSVGNNRFLCTIDTEDWCGTTWWAPECIRNPADGKYYYYGNSDVKPGWGVKGFSDSSTQGERFCVFIAVSDTPVGPFDVLYDIDAETGKRIPTINFQQAFGMSRPFNVIDISPFFDDNGDFYLYLRKESGGASGLNGIWGLKMKSMTVPDYSTFSLVTVPDYTTCSNKQGTVEDVAYEGEYFRGEGGVNEAPFMMKHNGKYYMTYASNGYGSVNYSVHQAVSDNPLTGFKKVDGAGGNPILDGGIFGNMNGTAHHAFVEAGDELYILFHRHNSNIDGDASSGRSMDVERVNWVTNPDGLEVLTANGPSYTLQWLPEAASEYRDIARYAETEASDGEGVEFLTDRILPYYTISEERTLWLESNEDNPDELTVTLKWDKPQSVSAIMIYNSANFETAFSKISEIRFKLAEKPSWAKKSYDYALIRDLKYPDIYYNSDTEDYIPIGPAVATFEPVMVTEITVVIKSKDRLAEFDQLGNPNNGLELSEIVVLGGKANG